MKNRTVYFEIAAFLLIAVVSTTYVLRQVGAGDPFTGTFSVIVELENAAGIAPGSEVAYRGVTVGDVESVEVDSAQDLVVMTLSIAADKQIPQRFACGHQPGHRRSGIESSVVLADRRRPVSG